MQSLDHTKACAGSKAGLKKCWACGTDLQIYVLEFKVITGPLLEALPAPAETK